MAASSITIEVDSEVKEEASRIAERFGFDLSSVTRVFYKQMIRENRIPFNLVDPEPNAESFKSIHEADRIITEGGRGYKSSKEMFGAMGL